MLEVIEETEEELPEEEINFRDMLAAAAMFAIIVNSYHKFGIENGEADIAKAAVGITDELLNLLGE